MMDLLSIALDLLDHGYCPIPLIRKEKRSAVKWKEYQTRKPTVEEVTDWFKRDYNIACVCGEISNCVCVDADTEEAVKYCRLYLPPTPYRVRTRKGIHFYYRHPGAKVQSKARIFGDSGPAIDIRADGGIAVCFGSLHETGYVYRLDEGADLVAASQLPLYERIWFPMPVLQPTLNAVSISGESMERAARYMAKIPGAGSGARNDTGFRLAAILGKDFSLDKQQAFTLLSEWNEKNDPPLMPREVEQLVESGSRYGVNQYGAKL